MAKMLNIIPDKCTGCMLCELACSWVQTGTFQPAHSLIRVSVFDEEASYAPTMCIQCDEAWCMTACPVNAIALDAQTGAKRIISSLCIGCYLCTLACPFGAVYGPPPDARKSEIAVKCDLCGGQPACAACCPTRAIEYVETEETGAWFDDWAEQVHTHHLAAVTDAAEGGN